LVDALETLNLSQYQYVSVHAPSAFSESEEVEVVNLLKNFIKYKWPIVLHPDAIHRFDRWSAFGDLLYIENMDKRKPIGRTVDELKLIFDRLPDALFCFDIAHARQVDSSMTEAHMILKEFGSRLRQIHISEVNTSSRHDRISLSAIKSFQLVSYLIPPTIPVIIETMVAEECIEDELERAIASLTPESVVSV
jgi:hypothetical protein